VSDVSGAHPTVVVDRVDVTYRVHDDSIPKLRKLFVGDGQQRRYREVEAVRHVSFLARPGEAIGIVGHNGSGKTTLLRAMTGLVSLTGGRVLATSVPVMLHVTAALERDLSGRRNIYLGGTALGLSRAELADREESIVRFAGLEDSIDLPIRTYSTGMRTRLQFAIATARTPEILVVDEALAVGDADFRARSEERIRKMIDGAATVFLVSHSLPSIVRVCSRVLWLNHGRLIADGDPAEVVDAYESYTKAARKPG